MKLDFANGEKRPHPLVGTVVEPYAILDVIAAGGMGVVFKARHMLTDRIVAMKLLPAELARDESNVQRVKLEAKALAQLNHPNIVTTFDFGFTYMQEPFIVMEYVAGESLKEVLDREVLLPVDRALKIFLQAVDAMRYAHSAKILHRDLKPHNIMVSDEPESDHVKILDFGVAKLAEYTQKITRTGEVVGSPLYMSPEQCTGRPTDHRCDIYSIGVMMFETLTGNPPFRGENYISTVHLKCTKLAPNFKDVVPGRVFPERLEMIVLKCLEIEPEKRYANMSELKSDLELLAGVVPRVERSKTSPSMSLSTNSAAPAHNRSPEGSTTTGSPGPGEIGWQPSWAGASSASNAVPKQNWKDEWSNSIVGGVSESDNWPTPSSPNLSSENWTSPEIAKGGAPLEQDLVDFDEDSNWVGERKDRSSAPDVVAEQTSTDKQPSGLLLKQDMASLSAALEAESLSKTDISPSVKPSELRPKSDEITGDKPVVSSLPAGPVPVPSPNKDPADSHFVLTWDSKTGPAWSATSAAPHKPKGPQQTTGTRLPSQAPMPQSDIAMAPQAVPQSEPGLPAPTVAQPPPSTTPPSSLISSVAAQGWTAPSGTSAQQIVNLQKSASVAPPPANASLEPKLPVAQQMQSQPPVSPGSPAQVWQPAPNAVPPGLSNQLASTQVPPATQAPAYASQSRSLQPSHPPPQLLPAMPVSGPAPLAAPHQTAMTQPRLPGTVPSPGGASDLQPPPLPGQSTAPPTPQQSGRLPDPWAESIPPRVEPQQSPPWGTQPTGSPGAASAPPDWSTGAPIDRGFDQFPDDSFVQSAQGNPSPPPPMSLEPPDPPGGPVELDWPEDDDPTVRAAKPGARAAQSIREEPAEPSPAESASPIKQLAMRMTNENKEDDGRQARSSPGPDFKSYEPVSLAELNAIKTPSVKSTKPTGESGLSTVLPAQPTSTSVQQSKPRTRFVDAEDDITSSARPSSSALRFSNSRGGNDGKKMVLIALVGAAIVAITAIVGFMILQHNSQSALPQKASYQSGSDSSTSATESAPSTAAREAPNASAPVQTGSTAGITSNTTIGETNKPAQAPTKTSTDKSKKRAPTVKVQKKPKRPKATNEEATASTTDAPIPRKRRAYSTYDSYYGSD